MKSLLLLLLLLWSTVASAIPAADAYPAAVTTSGLDPWVTLLDSGGRATVTPVLTTISGTPTTLNAFPTPTTVTSIGVSPIGTAEPAPMPTNTGAFEICHNVDGEFAPLCPMPNNNTLYVSETYYVTWDTSFYSAPNATVRVMANYHNATGGGPQAFESPQTLHSWGYVSLPVDKAWLQGYSSNNLTLFITSLGRSRQGSQQSVSLNQGPTITITSRPYRPYTPPDPTKAPTGASLYIALPTVIAFMILVICGLSFAKRKDRRIGLGNIMGRNRGYKALGKRSKRQRMGFGRKGDIKLSDVPSDWSNPVDDPFTDRPGTGKGTIPQPKKHHIRTASEGLDSLAGSPYPERSRDGPDWDFDFDPTPTRTKAVGQRGFVKDEVLILERQRIADRLAASSTKDRSLSA